MPSTHLSRKETSMVTISAKPASGHGDRSGFSLECTCGLRWGCSLEGIALNEAHAHEAWHQQKAGR
jgi:hypothetical protein